ISPEDAKPDPAAAASSPSMAQPEEQAGLTEQQRSRMRAYKNAGLSSEEMRRRRDEVGAQLRRQRHDEQVFKRRSLLPQPPAGEAAEATAADASDAASRMEECGGASDAGAVQGGARPGSPLPSADGLTLLVGRLAEPSWEARLEATRRLRHLLCRVSDPPVGELAVGERSRARLKWGYGVGLADSVSFYTCMCPKVLRFRVYSCVLFARIGTPYWRFASICGASHWMESKWAASAKQTGLKHTCCSPCSDALLQAGALPWLIAGLSESGHPALQFESAWAITNVASGQSRHSLAVAEAPGALAALVALLDSWERQPAQLTEQAAWALANIAGDSAATRDAVVAAGTIEPLARAVRHASGDGLVRVGAWCLANLCRCGNGRHAGMAAPQLAALQPCLPLLARLAFHSEPDILSDVCWALAYVSDGDNDRVQAVIDTGVCRRLVALIQHPQQLVARPALRAVGNLVLLNCQLLPALSSLLSADGPDWARKDTCWVTSNVAAGNRSQIQAVLDCSLAGPVLEALRYAEFGTRKEAAWFVANAASGGSPEQVNYLVSCGCLQPLCDLLNLPDARIVEVALTALEAVLRSGASLAAAAGSGRNPFVHLVEECSGLERLEYLQSHENERLYRRSHLLIDRYFSASADDEALDEERGLTTGSGGGVSGGDGSGGLAVPATFEFQEPPASAAGFHF
uniref:IBB domain-containing protein n=1 Tax=Macrostomum lignano TaxID=282301 RepID=A0A1I8HJ35_9PLAT